MYPHGIIYQSESGFSHGLINLKAPRRVRLAYFFLRGLGAGIVGFVLIAFLFSFWPIITSEVEYSVNANVIDTRPPQMVALENSIIDVAAEERNATLAEKIEKTQAEAKSLGVNSHFSLVVPKINAASNIVANVDPVDEKAYTEALKEGVAHAAGTYFPGQNKSIFLFSHSTNSPLNVAQYSAEFFLLRKLENKDKVIIFFADQKYEYEVVDQKTVAASDTEWLSKDFGEETLILQTCTPPGTNWQRLLVFAKRAT